MIELLSKQTDYRIRRTQIWSRLPKYNKANPQASFQSFPAQFGVSRMNQLFTIYNDVFYNQQKFICLAKEHIPVPVTIDSDSSDEDDENARHAPAKKDMDVLSEDDENARHAPANKDMDVLSKCKQFLSEMKQDTTKDLMKPSTSKG